MDKSTKPGFDVPIFLLCAWLASRLMWPCDPTGLPFDYLWGMLGILGSASWFYFFGRFRFTQINKADIAVVIFFSLYIISGLNGFVLGDHRAVFNCLWSASFWACAYLLVRQIANSEFRRNMILCTFLCAAGFLSVWGIYQRYVEYPQDKKAYESNPEQVLQSAGLGFEADSPYRESFESRFFAFEPTASFSLTNSLAAYLTPWFILIGAAGIQALGSRKIWGMAVLGALVLFAVFLTHSRSAILGIAFSILIGLLWILFARPGYKQGKIALLITLCSGFTLSVVAIYFCCPHLLDSAMLSMEYRFQYWDTTAQIIELKPWLGVGSGNFQNYYSQYMPMTAGETVSDPHNFLLEIAAFAGIPAATVFWGFLGILYYEALQSKQNRGIQEEVVQTEKSNENRIPWFLCGILFFSVAAGYFMGLIAMEQRPGPWGVILVSALGTALCVRPIMNSTFHFSAKNLVLAITGLLITLLTSGGIGYTNIAVAFWVLAALIINQTSAEQGAGLESVCQSEQKSFVFPGRTFAFALAALFLLCYVTGFSPVINSSLARSRAMNSVSLPEQLSYLEIAAQADSMSSMAHTDLARWRWEIWKQNRNQDNFDRFISESIEGLEHNPLSSVLWRQYGISLFRYGQLTGDYSRVNEAGQALENACSLYRADLIAKAYLALIRITSPRLTPGQEESCQTALSLLQLPESAATEKRDLIEQALLFNSRTSACEYGKQVIIMSDSTVHKNRKLPESLKKELLHAIQQASSSKENIQ